MKLNQLYNLDCRIGLKQMIQEGLKVDCVITSPPYWSLRDYGIEPSIWDGDSNCEHDFINNIRKVEGYNNKKGFWQNDEISRKNSPESWKELEIKDAFCSKCGAWKGTLGLEPDFNLFLKHLCDVYDLIWQVLKPSGTNWVNLGDSYGSGKCYDGKYNQGPIENKPPVKGYQKCLLMLPQRFAIEMINRGWILRNVIIYGINPIVCPVQREIVLL